MAVAVMPKPSEVAPQLAAAKPMPLRAPTWPLTFDEMPPQIQSKILQVFVEYGPAPSYPLTDAICEAVSCRIPEDLEKSFAEFKQILDKYVALGMPFEDAVWHIGHAFGTNLMEKIVVLLAPGKNLSFLRDGTFPSPKDFLDHKDSLRPDIAQFLEGLPEGSGIIYLRRIFNHDAEWRFLISEEFLKSEATPFLSTLPQETFDASLSYLAKQPAGYKSLSIDDFFATIRRVPSWTVPEIVRIMENMQQADSTLYKNFCSFLSKLPTSHATELVRFVADNRPRREAIVTNQVLTDDFANLLARLPKEAVRPILTQVAYNNGFGVFSDRQIMSDDTVDFMSRIAPEAVADYVTALGKRRSLERITSKPFFDFALGMPPFTQVAYMYALASIDTIGALISKEFVNHAVADFMSKLSPAAQSAYVTAFAISKGNMALTSERFFNFVLRMKAADSTNYLHELSTLGQHVLFKLFTSKEFLNKRNLRLIENFGAGNVMKGYPSSMFPDISSGKIIFSEEAQAASRDGKLRLDNVFLTPGETPVQPGRRRGGRYVTAIEQAATSRERPGTHYICAGYLNALLALDGGEKDGAHTNRFVHPDSLSEQAVFLTVVTWLRDNRRDLYNRIVKVAAKLRELNAAPYADAVQVGYKVAFPQNLDMICTNRLTPSDSEQTAFKQYLTSGFRAASHYSAPLVNFKFIETEIAKPSPDQKRLDECVEKIEAILAQQQGLRFTMPPLHGGARGEEPAPWSDRSFTLTRNVFQRIAVPVSEAHAIGWKEEFDEKKGESRRAKVRVPVEEAHELDEIARYETNVEKKTFFINSTEYSIIEGSTIIKERRLFVKVHQFSTRPTEAALGGAGIAVEIELDGTRHFLNSSEFTQLAAMLEKKTLASLLVEGEMHKLLGLQQT